MLLMIDNYDSFTYNLVQYLGELGQDVKVVRNDELTVAQIAALAPERTVKIGSAGKIFSLTGWKTGWLAAPRALAEVIARAHQYLTFATPPNLQAAVAFGTHAREARRRASR